MSENKNMSRRDFFKLGGLTAMSLPIIKVVGHIDGDVLLESEEEFGGFLVRTHAKDDPPYDVDDSIYQRFDQKNEAFCRELWDEEFQAKFYEIFRDPVEIMMENIPGQRREDFALTQAAYHVGLALGSYGGTFGGYHDGLYDLKPIDAMHSGMHQFPWDHSDLSNADITKMVKKASKLFGASLVGVADLDERWFYSNYYDIASKGERKGQIDFTDDGELEYQEDGALTIPRSMNKVIVLAFEMDYDGVMTSPLGPQDAAVGNGYSRMAFTASSVAEFIRNLGYKALPCGNNTGLSVPMAIDAGLGEVGRNGILINPKYGPRIRLAKIITDMPLETDSPISFGVTKFCEVCAKCARECPSESISFGERTREPRSISNNPGTLKWPIDATGCLNFWHSQGYMGCSVCIRTCPFNKPEGWLHEITRVLIGAQSGAVDKLLENLDDASGFGAQADPIEFWDKESYVHIKD